MRHLLCLAFAFPFLVCLTGCEDDDDPVGPSLDVPATYAFTRNGQSTVAFPGQTTRIAMAAELTEALLEPATSLEQLTALFRNPEGADPYTDPALNASDKSVRSKVAASARLFGTNATESAAIRNTFDGWLAGQFNEVFPAWNQAAAAGTPGQVADGSAVRYVNAWGLEYNQAVAKGLIGALMYDQLANNYLDALVLDASGNRANNEAGVPEDGKPYTTMEHKWDEAFGYLFGAADDPARPLDDLGSDDFLNKYLSRVEADPDYAGIAAEVEQAFRTGRAAIVAADYAERDRQAELIIDRLADVLAIRAVYYLMQGKVALENTPRNTGGAFHDLSEGYGFIYSLRFIDGDAAASDAYLATLRNAGGQGFWDIDPNTLATLAETIAADFAVDLTAAAN